MELNRQKTNALRDIIRTVRDVHTEFPPQFVEALLVVAQKPGITQVEVAEEINMSSAAASRIIAHALQREYGMVRQEPAPDNFRSKCIFLTEKGERFILKLQGHLK